MLLSIVDVIFADVAQPDQARIVALNAHHFLKNETDDINIGSSYGKKAQRREGAFRDGKTR